MKKGGIGIGESLAEVNLRGEFCIPPKGGMRSRYTKARASILMRGYGLIKSVFLFFKKIEISITKGF
jgi:hypothetical protein